MSSHATGVHTSAAPPAAAAPCATAIPSAPGSFGNRDGAPPRDVGGRPTGSPLPVVENQFVRSFVDVHPDNGLHGWAARYDREDPEQTDS
jgi:hypothetical protein